MSTWAGDWFELVDIIISPNIEACVVTSVVMCIQMNGLIKGAGFTVPL